MGRMVRVLWSMLHFHFDGDGHSYHQNDEFKLCTREDQVKARQKWSYFETDIFIIIGSLFDAVRHGHRKKI